MLYECCLKIDGLIYFPLVNTFLQNTKTIHKIKGLRVLPTIILRLKGGADFGHSWLV